MVPTTPGTRQPRTLRSKRLRALLWRAAGGRCQRCGGELGDDWEADHSVPWTLTHETNVHQMQALCRACNKRKAKMQLRSFQREFIGYCRDLLSGAATQRHVRLLCAPGAGKSTIPMIVDAELLGRGYDAICWVVPRTSLLEQGESDFQKPEFRALFGHRHQIRISTNDHDPSRTLAGHVTTYQAVGQNPAALLDEFRRRHKRYVLIRDEPHHVVEGSAWHRALQPVADLAALVIDMTGTLDGPAGKRLAWVPYDPDPTQSGKWTPRRGTTAETFFISYPLELAIQERALKQLDFLLLDARLEWTKGFGAVQQVRSFDEVDDDDNPAAVLTALATEYADRLLAESVRSWSESLHFNPRNKLLVVARSVPEGRRLLTQLGRLGVARAGIAVHEESLEARENIKRFKRPGDDPQRLDVLVTVQMAYEGMDVPPISHIACLTHIRSRRWLLQMLGRGQRVDRGGPPYEQQRCLVLAPADKVFLEVVEEIRRAQPPVVGDAPAAEEERAPAVGAGRVWTPWTPVVPVRGEANGREWVQELHTGDALSDAETARMKRLAEQEGLQGVPLIQLHRFAQAVRTTPATPPPPPAGFAGQAPPSVREATLRAAIERLARRLDSHTGQPFGTHNRLLWQAKKKRREDMPEPELEETWGMLVRWAAGAGLAEAESEAAAEGGAR